MPAKKNVQEGTMAPDGHSRPINKTGEIRYDRFKIKNEIGITGSVYIPRSLENPPDEIHLVQE